MMQIGARGCRVSHQRPHRRFWTSSKRWVRGQKLKCCASPKSARVWCGDAWGARETPLTLERRTSLRLSDGRVGHGYVQGRSRAHAEAAALCDALLQGGEHDVVMTKVIAPLMAARAAHKAERAAKAASTKVDFFTLVRGEAT